MEVGQTKLSPEAASEVHLGLVVHDRHRTRSGHGKGSVCQYTDNRVLP
jgi:hypothetical protein